MKKFILFISLVFIISACRGTTPEPAATPIPEPTATPIPEPTATPMPEPTATATPIPVILEDPIPSEVIYKEFLDNEYSAVKKYSEGYFYTQGKIMLMGFSGENPYIALDIPNVYENKVFLEEFLYCLISDEKNMDLIKINDTALVKARYENIEKDIFDSENIPWLTLIDCQIVDFKEGPEGPISNENLINEFIENQTNATTAYSSKESIKVSGKVDAILYENEDKVTILLFEKTHEHGTLCTVKRDLDNSTKLFELEKYGKRSSKDIGWYGMSKLTPTRDLIPNIDVIIEAKFNSYSPSSPTENGKINLNDCMILSVR